MAQETDKRTQSVEEMLKFVYGNTVAKDNFTAFAGENKFSMTAKAFLKVVTGYTFSKSFAIFGLSKEQATDVISLAHEKQEVVAEVVQRFVRSRQPRRVVVATPQPHPLEDNHALLPFFTE